MKQIQSSKKEMSGRQPQKKHQQTNKQTTSGRENHSPFFPVNPRPEINCTYSIFIQLKEISSRDKDPLSLHMNSSNPFQCWHTVSDTSFTTARKPRGHRVAPRHSHPFIKSLGNFQADCIQNRYRAWISLRHPFYWVFASLVVRWGFFGQKTLRILPDFDDRKDFILCTRISQHPDKLDMRR